MVLRGLPNYLGPGPLPLYLLNFKSSPSLSLIQSKKALKRKLVNSGLSQLQWASACAALAMLTQDMDASTCGRITACFAHILLFVNHICAENESDKHGGTHLYLLYRVTQKKSPRITSVQYCGVLNSLRSTDAIPPQY